MNQKDLEKRLRALESDGVSLIPVAFPDTVTKIKITITAEATEKQLEFVEAQLRRLRIPYQIMREKEGS